MNNTLPLQLRWTVCGYPYRIVFSVQNCAAIVGHPMTGVCWVCLNQFSETGICATRGAALLDQITEQLVGVSTFYCFAQLFFLLCLAPELMLTLPKLLLSIFTADWQSRTLWTEGLLHKPVLRAGPEQVRTSALAGTDMCMSKGEDSRGWKMQSKGIWEFSLFPRTWGMSDGSMMPNTSHPTGKFTVQQDPLQYQAEQ